MITRMSIPERAKIMRECMHKVSVLHGEFWELLTENFAPPDARNYTKELSAEDRENGTLPYNDKDTPLIRKVFTLLDEAFCELIERCKDIDAEEDARDEAQQMFYAWELGLCPYAMREYRRKKIPYVWNSLNWDEIAKNLTGVEMSYEDTVRAVEEYLKDKAPDGDNVIAVTREIIRLKTA